MTTLLRSSPFGMILLARRVIGWGLAALGLVAAVWGAVALGLGAMPVNADWRPPAEDSPGVEIFLLSNGFHVDLLLPMHAAGIDWREPHPFWHFESADPEAPFIGFGWGDRDFYLETRRLEDMRVGTAVRALLGLNGALIHVGYYHRPIDDPAVARLRIAPDTYRRLAGHLRAAFRRDVHGSPVRLPRRGYGPADTFYEGLGSYSPILTCNEWVGHLLRASGLPTGVWTPLPHSLLQHWQDRADGWKGFTPPWPHTGGW